jgi:3-phosphoshikimate 1-carboxyvinyltransferase
VVTEVELIVVAVPVMAMTEVFSSIAGCFDSDVIVMDVGSVKGPVVQALENVHGSVPTNFVPAHPIAGSEKHGVSAANADLFKAHKVILTPGDETAEAALAGVTDLWESLGADVTIMQAEHHDLILAQTSHLPHLLAYALIDTLSSQGDSLEIFDYAAGGLRDFSRIASSDPQMWRDIFQSNRKPLLEILDRYMSELGELRDLIATDEIDKVFECLVRAKAARDHFSKILADRKT